MARRQKATIPSSRYASSRIRRSRKVKVKLLIVPGPKGNAWDKDVKAANRPLNAREWTSRIDKALARIAKPAKPATGYPRPIADARRGVANRPKGWTYSFLTQ